MDHAPALRRLKAPVDRGQLQRCLPLPTFTTTCHACAGERTALSCRPRRPRRPSAPLSGGGDLSAGSSHRSVQTSAYLLKTICPRCFGGEVFCPVLPGILACHISAWRAPER